MVMIVLFTLGSARVADSCTEFEHFAQYLIICSSAANCELSGRFANIGAVSARTDALAHVHVLGSAGVGAAEAHACTVHEVMSGIAERLVHMPGNLRMKCDHLANGHGVLLGRQTCG